MFLDEKWFNQDGLFNRQNGRVYAPSRSAANESGGLGEEHKHPFQVSLADSPFIEQPDQSFCQKKLALIPISILKTYFKKRKNMELD